VCEQKVLPVSMNEQCILSAYLMTAMLLLLITCISEEQQKPCLYASSIYMLIIIRDHSFTWEIFPDSLGQFANFRGLPRQIFRTW